VEESEVRRVQGAPELKSGTVTAFVAGPYLLSTDYILVSVISSWHRLVPAIT